MTQTARRALYNSKIIFASMRPAFRSDLAWREFFIFIKQYHRMCADALSLSFKSKPFRRRRLDTYVTNIRAANSANILPHLLCIRPVSYTHLPRPVIEKMSSIGIRNGRSLFLSGVGMYSSTASIRSCLLYTSYKAFARPLKFGVYDNYGADKDFLKDLLLFYSSKEQKNVTLEAVSYTHLAPVLQDG